MALLHACQQFTTEARVLLHCRCEADVLTHMDYTLDEVIDAASDVVVNATGGRVRGRCTTTVRPCSDYSCSCGRASDSCMCCRLDGIRLPGEMIDITSVKIDGVTLDPLEYGWLDGDRLVRVGAERTSWPGCQHLQRADTEEGTFSITYVWGILPFEAVMAATEISCEFIAGITSKTSRLDPRVIAAIMDGVTVDFDPTKIGFFEWTQRLVSAYPTTPPSVVWSPEVDDNWTLHTLRAT